MRRTVDLAHFLGVTPQTTAFFWFDMDVAVEEHIVRLYSILS
jgi:hypothetical protein